MHGLRRRLFVRPSMELRSARFQCRRSPASSCPGWSCPISLHSSERRLFSGREVFFDAMRSVSHCHAMKFERVLKFYQELPVGRGRQRLVGYHWATVCGVESSVGVHSTVNVHLLWSEANKAVHRFYPKIPLLIAVRQLSGLNCLRCSLKGLFVVSERLR